MKLSDLFRGAAPATLLLVAAVVSGCQNPNHRTILGEAHIPPPPHPHGAVADAIWWRMEANAEASDFVLNENVFEHHDSVRLNDYGRQQLINIALRLKAGAPFPVIVERSMYALDPNAGPDDFNYPIHPDPQLDNERREAIAAVLAEMGVPNATDRVIVSEDIAPQQQGFQAVQNAGRFATQPQRSNVLGVPGFGPRGFGGFGGFGFSGFGGGFF